MSRLLRIAAREYLSFLKTPGFWISLLLAPVGAAVGGVAPGLLDRSTPTPTLAVIDLTRGDIAPRPGAAVQARLRPARRLARLVPPPPDMAGAVDSAAAGTRLRAWLSGNRALPGGGRLDAAAVLSGPPDAVTVDFWSRSLADRGVEEAVRDAVAATMRQAVLREAGLDPRLLTRLDAAQPVVRDFSPQAASEPAAARPVGARVGARVGVRTSTPTGQVSLRDRLPGVAGFGLAVMLWALIITCAGLLLNSVIEEKANRVLEVLLSSADTVEILGGKILGVAGLAATVLCVWGGIGLAGLAHAQPRLFADLVPALARHGLIGWFLLYFAFGYLMYAALFAAIGSFCETTREAQTLLGPVMIGLTIPLLFLSSALRRPDAPMIRALSWFPPFTPFLMTARAASGPPLWEMAGTLLTMIAATAAVLWLSGRAFRAGALSTLKLDPRAGLLGLARAWRGRRG